MEIRLQRRPQPGHGYRLMDGTIWILKTVDADMFTAWLVMGGRVQSKFIQGRTADLGEKLAQMHARKIEHLMDGGKPYKSHPFDEATEEPQ